MDNVIIVNKEEFEGKKKAFIEGGKDKIHVISDFDRTLTKAFIDGKKLTAIIMQLYDGDYLSEDYREKAQALHKKYYSIEVDPDIPIEDKIKAMEEWWRTHKQLLIDSELNINDVKKVVDNGSLEFREGIEEFLDLLKDKNIPIIVFSASGLGEAIRLYFEKINKMYDNVHLIINSLEYDEEGFAAKIREPIIHVLNKGEIALKGLPVRDKLLDRKNVLLLGDGLGDLNMIEGFDYDDIIKIGFFNYEDDEKLGEFKEGYDVIITGDGDFSFINELLQEIIG